MSRRRPGRDLVRRPPPGADAAWGIAFAWPGCERTAPLFAVRYPTEDEAIAALRAEAEGWKRSGRHITLINDREWVITRHEAPDKPRAKLVARQVDGEGQRP